MSKFSDLFRQEASRRASKATADAIRSQKNGSGAYSFGGKIFIGCGIGWLLISLIPIATKNPIIDCLWMWILAAIQIIGGAMLVILSKKSKKFQEWADKDFTKSLKQQKRLEEKVKIGKKTLPITYGDILALKIIGILAAGLIVILGIGYLQGWVVW